MQLREALVKVTSILKDGNIETPAQEAGVILCHALKKDKTFIYAHGDYGLNEEEQSRILGFAGRRAEGVPLQHLTGYQEFMSLDFKVGPEVLIPRQDTEILVETVIDHVNSAQIARPCIMDIGTGSGCVAVSLAYYLKDAEITAVDISLEALRVAQENADSNNVGGRIEFLQGSLFDGLAGRERCKKAFDIIVSNPPYIPTCEIGTLKVEVRCHDPLLALDGGEDGLKFYREITSRSAAFLKQSGLLAFEVGYNQAAEVSYIMKSNFFDIRTIKDLAVIERVVTGRLKE